MTDGTPDAEGGIDPGMQAICTRCGRDEHPDQPCRGDVATRFKPGQSGNPSGRRKGSFSIRSALKSRLAANPVDVDGVLVGLEVLQLTHDLIEASRLGNVDLVKTITALIHEAEGKPTEHIERTDNRTRTIVVHEGPETPPAMP